MSGLVTLAELRKQEIAVPDVLVEGILSAGETRLLVGRPKTGKSRLVQQLALALSRGEPFLGHPTPSARTVLMLDLENRPAGVKQRFSHMAPEDSGGDERILIYAPETLAEDAVNATSEGIQRMERLLRQGNPDVLVVDTWRLFVGGDENKADVVVNALKKLAAVRRDRPGLATLIVHHLRKEQTDRPVRLREDPSLWFDAVSGHNALVSHVDACFGLEREGDLIVFGGIARYAASTVMLPDEDEEHFFSISPMVKALPSKL